MMAPEDILLSCYAHLGAGRGFLVEPAHVGDNSSNYLIRLGDAAAVPSYVLKSESVERSEYFEEVDERLARHQHAAQLCDLLPPIIPTMDGGLSIERDGFHWRLQEYRPGVRFDGSEAEMLKAAQGLAHLQLNLRGLPGHHPTSWQYSPIHGGELEQVRKNLVGDLAASHYGQKLRTLLDGMFVPATKRVMALEAIRALPRTWVHHDFHPANALFEHGKLSAILDHDSLAVDLRMQAVVFSASRFCKDMPIEAVWRFLATYHAIDPLTPLELSLYPDFIMREALRRINWTIRVNVLEGRDLWRGAIDMQMGILESAESLRPHFQNPGDDFAARLRIPG